MSIVVVKTRTCPVRGENGVGGGVAWLASTMHLLPRERDKLQLREAGLLAQQRLARGVRLNMTEAIALLSVVLHEHIRDGTNTVAALMQHGKTILGFRHVKPGVAQSLRTLVLLLT